MINKTQSGRPSWDPILDLSHPGARQKETLGIKKIDERKTWIYKSKGHKLSIKIHLARRIY